MDVFEQREVLRTFRILVDKREQPTDRAKKRYESFGAPWERATLDYGDYTYNAALPTGSMIFNSSVRVQPLLAIERKMNLDELAECFTRSRARFEREFQRAAAAGGRIILICENATWENLLAGKYRSRFTPQAFEASIEAWTVRYGLSVLFCKEETSGRLIKGLLYRDLKERVERGEFG